MMKVLQRETRIMLDNLTQKQLEDKIAEFGYKTNTAQLGKGNWRYRIYLESTKAGKEKTKSRFPTKRAASEALYEKLLEMRAEEARSEGQGTTLDEAWAIYINATDIAYATKERKMRDYKNHLNPALGSKSLSQITTSLIDSYLDEKKSTLSIGGARLLRLLLNDIFQCAVKNGLCKDNPVCSSKVIEDPRSHKEIQTYSWDEIEWMNVRFQTTSCFTAYVLALEAGLLPNEIFALRLSDLHLSESGPAYISVTKQIGSQDKSWCLLPLPKSCNVREVQLNEETAEYLKQVVAATAEVRKQALPHQNWVIDKTKGNRGNPKPICVSDFLNIKPDGEMLNPNSVKVISRIAKDELGLRLDFHFLRHTYALHSAIHGVNPYQLQKQLGIGKFNLVIRFYEYAMSESNHRRTPPSLVFQRYHCYDAIRPVRQPGCIQNW